MTSAPVSPTPIPANEDERLDALERLAVLDQDRTQDLDSLARLAAYVCGTTTAAINLIDEDRQWSAAAHGFEPEEIDRADSMCATSITSIDVSYTPDASSDPRWRTNPSVTGVIDEVRLYAAAPLVLSGGEVIGTLCAFSTEAKTLTRLQLERLRDLAEHAVRILELRRATVELGQASTRDSLTGLPNRSVLDDALRLAVAKQLRGESAPSVIFIDLDGFRVVNDTYGRAAGDELLRAVASRLLANVRASDLLARLGDDEYVVLCDTPIAAAPTLGIATFVDRLRDCFELPFALSFGSLTIGASMGVVTSKGEAPAVLLARADLAMYQDKQG